MKKRYTLLALLCLFCSFSGNATHMQGAQIRYEWNGTNYTIFVDVYYSCGITGISTSTQVKFLGCSSFTRNLPLVEKDSLTRTACPGMAYCGSSAQSYLVVGRYSDTVSLAPCAAWTISTDQIARFSVDNLLNPVTANVYVAAMLNNSAAPNSSPSIANLPPFYMGAGSSSHSVQALDLEGDSVAYEMVQPQGTNAFNIPYSPTFSLAMPFSTLGTLALNTAAAQLDFTSTALGRYAIVLRVKDYRNGQLVGYTTRDWGISSYGAVQTPPLPAATNPLTYNTCPGQANSLSFTFNDPVATDSVFLSILPPSIPGFSFVTNYTPGIGTGSGTITWTTPAGFNPATLPYFFIKIHAWDQVCPVRGFAEYSVLVNTAQCNTDTVWAGDANADYTVNMYDPLAVALAFGKTGPTRPSASTAWTPQWCGIWSYVFNNAVNMKHADCDGDGTVNNTDLAAITANYGLVHPKENGEEENKETGVPELRADLTGITLMPGGTVTVPLTLGDASSSMAGLFGLATKVKVDGITLSAAPTVSYSGLSWLGTAANTVRWSNSTSTSSIDWAYARNDGQGITGNGALAYLTFTIPAGTAMGSNIVLSFANTKVIAPNGAELTGYASRKDTGVVGGVSVGNVPTSFRYAGILPNPSTQHATLLYNLESTNPVQLQITDMRGAILLQQTLRAATGEQEVALPSSIAAGLYVIRLRCGDESRMLKWVKTQ